MPAEVDVRDVGICEVRRKTHAFHDGLRTVAARNLGLYSRGDRLVLVGPFARDEREGCGTALCECSPSVFFKDSEYSMATYVLGKTDERTRRIVVVDVVTTLGGVLAYQTNVLVCSVSVAVQDGPSCSVCNIGNGSLGTSLYENATSIC